ncbi:hypothetical protein GPECTOR_30g205 [Gonium pectorale]|uniref:protein-serine/threonine phosphatase n=1 Tax=Gonium pectorale TaxID=33097 RepID=A0A150GFL1_GONPE|nr:hypothetical protein GPECTOR_30g205 [Gonium pectorale]|eukprot:KXZ48110.1 hypothetical protein GPECTOR_30g205 [Gonium pectorale]
MEDAYAAEVPLRGAEGVALFALYDGHGGAEVARYSALHMGRSIRRAPTFHEAFGGASYLSPSPSVSPEPQRAPTPGPACPPSNGAASSDGDGLQRQRCGSLAAPREGLVAGDGRQAAREAALREAFLSLDRRLGEEGAACELMGLANPGAVTAAEEDYGRRSPGGPFVGPVAGSTATVVLVERDGVTVAAVGDSRCIIGSRAGGLVAATTDHKGSDPAERERVERAGCWVSASGRVCGELDMSRALGDSDMKRAVRLPQHLQAVTADPQLLHLGLELEQGEGEEEGGNGEGEEGEEADSQVFEAGEPAARAAGSQQGKQGLRMEVEVLVAEEEKEEQKPAARPVAGLGCAAGGSGGSETTSGGSETSRGAGGSETGGGDLEGVLPVSCRDVGCYLLLASDGLWNVMDNAQVHAFVTDRLAAGLSPETVCAQLCVEACISERTAYDNVTVLLVLMHGVRPAASASGGGAAAAAAATATVDAVVVPLARADVEEGMVTEAVVHACGGEVRAGPAAPAAGIAARRRLAVAAPEAAGQESEPAGSALYAEWGGAMERQDLRQQAQEVVREAGEASQRGRRRGTGSRGRGGFGTSAVGAVSEAVAGPTAAAAAADNWMPLLSRPGGCDKNAVPTSVAGSSRQARHSGGVKRGGGNGGREGACKGLMRGGQGEATQATQADADSGDGQEEEPGDGEADAGAEPEEAPLEQVSSQPTPQADESVATHEDSAMIDPGALGRGEASAEPGQGADEAPDAYPDADPASELAPVPEGDAEAEAEAGPDAEADDAAASQPGEEEAEQPQQSEPQDWEAEAEAERPASAGGDQPAASTSRPASGERPGSARPGSGGRPGSAVRRASGSPAGGSRPGSATRRDITPDSVGLPPVAPSGTIPPRPGTSQSGSRPGSRPGAAAPAPAAAHPAPVPAVAATAPPLPHRGSALPPTIPEDRPLQPAAHIERYIAPGLRAIEVEVEQGPGLPHRLVRVLMDLTQCDPKPYLGGFRNKRTGAVYHHAGTQTPRAPKYSEEDRKLSRETQTVKVKVHSQQTVREQATQMERPGMLLDTTYDKEVTPGVYQTADEREAIVIAATRCIQRWVRGWMGRRRAAYLRRKKAEREAFLREQELAAQTEAEEHRRREIQRRMHPRSAADFEVLYNELEAWRLQETRKIKEAGLAKDQEQQVLQQLLHKETKLLQTIDRLKINANHENKEARIQHTLTEMSRPKKFTLRNGGKVDVHTPFTTRAKELQQLYNGLNLPLLTVDERLDVLLHVKWTVKEFDCDLTREVVDLIDREADMLNRGRNPKMLEGLRKRISSLFLNFIETPEFNPEAARFQIVPMDFETYLYERVDKAMAKAGTSLGTRPTMVA